MFLGASLVIKEVEVCMKVQGLMSCVEQVAKAATPRSICHSSKVFVIRMDSSSRNYSRLFISLHTKCRIQYCHNTFWLLLLSISERQLFFLALPPTRDLAFVILS